MRPYRHGYHEYFAPNKLTHARTHTHARTYARTYARTHARTHAHNAPLLSPPTQAVAKGDRIAQLILEKISTPEIVEVDDLDATDRGEGGFGSTGGFGGKKD